MTLVTKIVTLIRVPKTCLCRLDINRYGIHCQFVHNNNDGACVPNQTTIMAFINSQEPTLETWEPFSLVISHYSSPKSPSLKGKFMFMLDLRRIGWIPRNPIRRVNTPLQLNPNSMVVKINFNWKMLMNALRALVNNSFKKSFYEKWKKQLMFWEFFSFPIKMV